ncbi:MAG: hypothetical protein K9H16_08965, partial [Bacteroidales bacterium]|nr:hypothetical protein [Bacteroidales bacterium]
CAFTLIEKISAVKMARKYFAVFIVTYLYVNAVKIRTKLYAKQKKFTLIWVNQIRKFTQSVKKLKNTY